MLSIIVNALLSTAVNKPKITKDVVVAGISAATAFLMFSIAIVYSLSVLKLVIIVNARVNPVLAELYIAGGCLVLAAILAYAAKGLFVKAKKRREAPLDKALNLVDAFMDGFNTPSEATKPAAPKNNTVKLSKVK